MARRGENIYKRKDGRWEGRIKKDDVLINNHKYQSVYGKTYREVKEKMSIVKQNLKSEFPKYHDTVTMITAAQMWLQSKETNWKPSTYAIYHQLISKYIIPYLGNISINKIDNYTMENFVSSIKKQNAGNILSSNYLFQICAIVRMILSHMNQKYDHSITVPINPIKKKYKRQLILPSKTSMTILEKYLIANCKDNTCLGILIAFHTGIRIGELSALMWEDIDMNEEIIYIRKNIIRIKKNGIPSNTTRNITHIIEQVPKTSDSFRTIPIPPQLIPLLQIYKKENSIYVISGSKTPWAEPRTIQYRFMNILKKCKIDYFNFHMLRHAFATRCVAMGLDIKSLSEILGHSNIQITLNLYVHSTIQQKKQFMKQYELLQKIL